MNPQLNPRKIYEDLIVLGMSAGEDMKKYEVPQGYIPTQDDITRLTEELARSLQVTETIGGRPRVPSLAEIPLEKRVSPKQDRNENNFPRDKPRTPPDLSPVA